MTYNYVAYAVAMPATGPFAVYQALAALSVYAMFGLLTAMDSAAIQQRLGGAVRERLSGGVLAGFVPFALFARGVASRNN